MGKLVTRVTNDTNAISMMFTNLLVNLAKNAFVILGILVAMLCLNYELTLMAVSYTHLDVYKRQHQHLSVGESLRHQGDPDFRPRGRENGGIPHQKPASGPRKP